MFGRLMSPALAEVEVEALLAGGRGAPHPLHPYIVAKLAEDPELELVAPEIASHLRRHRKEGWTTTRVAGMSTEEIEAQLKAFGVPFDHGPFVAKTSDNGSAWDIATNWIEEHPVICRKRDQIFLGVAAVELWKRLAGDRLSEEMLDDQMQEGYSLLRAGRDEDGAEAWWGFWQTARVRVPADVRRLDELGLVAGMQMMSNWVSDFRELAEDLGRFDQFDASRGIAFVEDLRRLFPRQDDGTQVSWNRDLAFFLAAGQRKDEALQVLEQGLLRWPRDAWAYVAVADEYANFWRWREPILPKDLDRARSVLHEGLAAVAPDDRNREVLHERLRAIDNP